MEIKQAYNLWADQYDTNENKTRDLEKRSLRETLNEIEFHTCLEIGCGTGKNTEWLITRADRVLAVDLSDQMLGRARNKISSPTVEFVQADILQEWSFVKNEKFDLTIFSLVLEHIENLDSIFRKVANVASDAGYIYIGELHPFKQYLGTKARFEINDGLKMVTCFTHNLSDFAAAGKKQGFKIMEIKEYFDGDDQSKPPRIMTLLLQRDESFRLQKPGLDQNFDKTGTVK